MGWMDYLREGAADLTGVRDELDTLREQSFTAQALARRVEDVNWWDLLRLAGEEEYQQSESARRRVLERAWRYYFDHPVVARTIDQIVQYTFGNGAPPPRFVDNEDSERSDEDAGNEAINRFWKDPENQAALTGYDAQISRAIEREVAANIFLRLYPADGPGVEMLSQVSAEVGEPRTSLKIADVPEQEIRDIIRHPENSNIPLYYKRVYSPRVFDPTQGVEGTYVQAANPIVEYIPDWRFAHLDPREHEGRPWGPAARWTAGAGYRMGTGFIYHVHLNKVGKMKFGVSPVQRTMKWAQGIDQYMTARMNTVLAIARMAMRAKVRGGPKNVSQIAAAVADIGRLQGALEGTNRMERRPVDMQGATRASVENEGVDLQPMVQDTNAQSARGDLDMMLSMVSAGSGVPGGYLGLLGQQGAQLTTLDGGFMKLIQQRQLLWSTVFLDLTRYAVRLEGLDPERVQHSMPPILERDASALAAWLIGVYESLDPNKANREMMRWLLLEILESMGKPNGKEIVDRLLPEEMPTPAQQTLDAEQITGELEQGTPGAPRSAATTAADAADSQDIERNNLRFRGTDRPGGGAQFSAESRERRRQRAQRESDLDRLREGLTTELADGFERLLAPDAPPEPEPEPDPGPDWSAVGRAIGESMTVNVPPVEHRVERDERGLIKRTVTRPVDDRAPDDHP